MKKFLQIIGFAKEIFKSTKNQEGRGWIRFFSSLMTAFLFSLSVNAQDNFLTGRVWDISRNEPLVGAEVFAVGTSFKTLTDVEGFYQLKLGTEKKYKVAVFYQGYESKIIDWESGKEDHINFELNQFEKLLNEVTVSVDKEQTFGLSKLNSVEGTAIYEAKKNDVILMKEITANLATNNSRQIYAKVAGLNIWESDGAGIQLGVGARGLSPNRTSNFSTRQNGYEISADALGYPESYYSPPAEAVESIQVVRGASSLQYGTQFGGLLNFVLKKAPKDKLAEVTSRQTIGSFGLFNSFNSLGGTYKKLSYYTFVQHKRGNGWRPNSNFTQNTVFMDLHYHANDKLFFSMEYTYMDYLAQQPGGLTDMEFRNDPTISKRDRNWFKVNWNLFALTTVYKINDRTKVNNRSFGLIAGRDALGNLERIDRADDMAERNLIRDEFRNIGNETRLLHHYSFFNNQSVFVIGSRFYKGFTLKQQGFASSGKGPDFKYLNPEKLENSDYEFPSNNYAAFIENIFNVTDKFSVTPGVRFEYIQTKGRGYYMKSTKIMGGDGFSVDSTYKENEAITRARSFPFFGVGLSYKTSASKEFYSNLSQNYRAITFNDIRVVNPSMVVDENIQDENGYNFDFGVKGNLNQKLTYDISVFYLAYNNRIGRIIHEEKLFRTNIGDSRTIGLEAFVETDLLKCISSEAKDQHLNWFINTSLMEGKYIRSRETNYVGNHIEFVPAVNLKTGLLYQWKSFKSSLQFTYMGEQFSDATNTFFHPIAVMGIIPAYHVLDLSLSYTYHFMTFETGANNLTNNIYFTRRAEGYPGPGIIPSDPRNYYFTLQLKF